jgi:hypothetical protein
MEYARRFELKGAVLPGERAAGAAQIKIRRVIQALRQVLSGDPRRYFVAVGRIRRTRLVLGFEEINSS